MKKIFNFSRVSHKVTQTILILMVAVILAFACVLIPLEVQLLNQQMETNEEQIKSVAFENFDKMVTDLLDSSIFLSTVKIFNLPNNHTNEDYKNYLNMRNQMSAVVSINKYVSELYISDGCETVGLLQNETTTKNDDYNSIIDSKKTVVFEAENFQFFKTEDGTYYFHYALKNLSNNKVLLKLDKKSFSDEIFVQAENIVYQCWLDKSGEIVFATNKNTLGNNFEDVFKMESKAAQKERKNIDFYGEEGKLTLTKENDYSFRLVTVLNQDIYQNSQQILYVGIGIFILIAIFVFVVTVIINNMTYKPFKELLALVGDKSANVVLDKNNAEFNYIVSNIKKIIEENANLNLQTDELLERFKEQQFIACQMQISPHFLFNTLSSISGLSVMTLSEFDNPITKAINNLANMLSEVLLSSSRVVTIEKEIELTKTYIQILLLRFKDKFTVEWDVDEELKKEFIIKLSLQPLIENAIQHAFDWNDEEAKVCISIKRKGEEIFVKVADNGVGMSQKQLTELRATMNDFTLGDKKIGLRNTNHRLKLLYGDKYEISVESKEGRGTTFEFSYPIN